MNLAGATVLGRFKGAATHLAVPGLATPRPIDARSPCGVEQGTFLVFSLSLPDPPSAECPQNFGEGEGSSPSTVDTIIIAEFEHRRQLYRHDRHPKRQYRCQDPPARTRAGLPGQVGGEHRGIRGRVEAHQPQAQAVSVGQSGTTGGRPNDLQFDPLRRLLAWFGRCIFSRKRFKSQQDTAFRPQNI